MFYIINNQGGTAKVGALINMEGNDCFLFHKLSIYHADKDILLSPFFTTKGFILSNILISEFRTININLR